jgi:hypothetical protein
MHISKLRDSVSARRLSPWEIAAITVGSVVVTAAGAAAVGYIWYVTRQNAEGLDGVHLAIAKP